ncbi:MAG: hypothetical protein K0U47_11405 [Epsilonproteobacteria bacterium]|nr:hypothetical protein [Campylobacterota bacterium]
MFIYKPTPSEELQKIIDPVQRKFGIVPPHWELLAFINPVRFQLFIQEITYLQTHPHINPDLFAMLRLYVANREHFKYCQSFNTKLLLAKGFDKNTIKALKKDAITIPLDEKHQLLAQKAIKALYEPLTFDTSDITSLKERGWTDGDIYDAIDHAAFLFKFSKIIQAYTL